VIWSLRDPKSRFGWDVGHFAGEIHRGSGSGDEMQRLVAVDAHAWVPQQLVGLRQDALDGFFGK
jgi:hypothetical protein